MMNRTELRAEMARKGVTARAIAREMGISEQAFYNKMAQISEFKESEIRVLIRMLDLTPDQINLIFLPFGVN